MRLYHILILLLAFIRISALQFIFEPTLLTYQLIYFLLIVLLIVVEPSLMFKSLAADFPILKIITLWYFRL